MERWELLIMIEAKLQPWGVAGGIIEDQLMEGEEIKMLRGQAARRTALSTLG